MRPTDSLISLNLVNAIMNKKHKTTAYVCERNADEVLHTEAEHVKSVSHRRMYEAKPMEAGRKYLLSKMKEYMLVMKTLETMQKSQATYVSKPASGFRLSFKAS
jgi:hypothetical protein